MALGLSCTQTERDALAAAIKSGALSVVYDGKRVEYRSLADMLQTLALMNEFLAGATSRSSVASFSRG
jgi:hypothetical protein